MVISRDSWPSRHCAVEFQALPARIGQVRRIVSAQLRFWHLDALIDRAALGLTELLANVHEHAGPDKHCTVEMNFGERLTVSVHDHDPSLPRLRSSGILATSGRGLALVAALSDSWGMQAQQDGSGKTVWFTLPSPFSTAPPATVATAGTEPGRTDTAWHGGPPGAAAPVERRPRASHA